MYAVTWSNFMLIYLKSSAVILASIIIRIGIGIVF